MNKAEWRETKEFLGDLEDLWHFLNKVDTTVSAEKTPIGTRYTLNNKKETKDVHITSSNTIIKNIKDGKTESYKVVQHDSWLVKAKVRLLKTDLDRVIDNTNLIEYAVKHIKNRIKNRLNQHNNQK